MESLLPKKQFEDLQNSIDWSLQQFTFPRKNRLATIKELSGKHYMPGGADKIMPVNGLKLAYDIYLRYLAARNPKGMFSTRDPQLRVTAKEFELAVNQIPEEIGLSFTLRKVVGEALVASLGIVKCGRADGATFVDCITLDDYFCDMSARNWEVRQYEGNDYWMDFEDFEEKEWKNMQDVKEDEFEIVGAEGEQRAESVSNSSTPKPYRKKIWLRDVWLPKEQVMVTYGIKTKKQYNLVPFDTDDPVPYITLGYTYIPGNLLPYPPAASWRDLNELSNSLFRKLGASADAYKELLGFPNGDAAEIEAFKQAHHGSGIKYTGVDPKLLKAGGVDPKTLAFYLQVKELQSYYAGSLDSLGGLAPMSATIGQDKLLAEAAGAQMRDMSDQTIDFVRKIFKALAYYEWQDPLTNRQLQKKIPEAGTTVNVQWNNAKKQGKFSDYDIDIDVYKFLDDSPSLRLQKLGAITQQYILPFLPMIQQLGGNFDIEKLLKTISQYANVPELDEIVSFPDDPIPQQSGSQNQYIGAPKSPQGGAGSAVPQQSPGNDMMQQLMSMD